MVKLNADVVATIVDNLTIDSLFNTIRALSYLENSKLKQRIIDKDSYIDTLSVFNYLKSEFNTRVDCHEYFRKGFSDTTLLFSYLTKYKVYLCGSRALNWFLDYKISSNEPWNFTMHFSLDSLKSTIETLDSLNIVWRYKKAICMIKSLLLSLEKPCDLTSECSKLLFIVGVSEFEREIPRFDTDLYKQVVEKSVMYIISRIYEQRNDPSHNEEEYGISIPSYLNYGYMGGKIEYMNRITDVNFTIITLNKISLRESILRHSTTKSLCFLNPDICFYSEKPQIVVKQQLHSIHIRPSTEPVLTTVITKSLIIQEYSIYRHPKHVYIFKGLESNKDTFFVNCPRLLYLHPEDSVDTSNNICQIKNARFCTQDYITPCATVECSKHHICTKHTSLCKENELRKEFREPLSYVFTL